MDWVPKPDREAQALAQRIAASVTAKKTEYGLATGDAVPFAAELTAFSNKLNAADAAKAAQNTAVAEKDMARLALEEKLRAFVMRVQLLPTLTDATRADAGIPVRDTTRTFVAPIPPRDLVANAGAGGTHDLKWNANGNTDGVQYVIEVKRAGAAAFSLVDVVTTTKASPGGFVVGQRADFQVRARRGGQTSDPSNVATVHAG